jgi:hypothetical protein
VRCSSKHNAQSKEVGFEADAQVREGIQGKMGGGTLLHCRTFPMVTLPRTGLYSLAMASTRDMGRADCVDQVTFMNHCACWAVAPFTVLTDVTFG